MKSKNELEKLIDSIKEATSLNQEEIALRMGYSRSYLSEAKKSGGTEKILNALRREFQKELDFPTITQDGKSNYIQTRQELKNSRSKEKRIPLYDAPAAAGITETDMTPIHAPAGTIDVGDLLNDSQAAIRIYGNSMIPNYPPGCVVGLAKCSSLFIEPGEVYVIETRDRRILKRIFYKDDNAESDHFLCYSDNTMIFEGGARHGKSAYPPFLLPKSEIINLFAVTGVIKRNSNSVIINRGL